MGIKEFGKNIGKGVKKATDKLNNAVDIQKLKYKISKKEEEIGELYRALGQNVVEAALSGSDYSAFITKTLEELAVKRAEIAELNRERIEKEGKIICDNCHNENDSDAEFCSRCGAKIEKRPSEEETAEEAPDAHEEPNEETAEEEKTEETPAE